jgi:hypothetical protein
MLAMKPTYKRVDRKDVQRSNGRSQGPTNVTTGSDKCPCSKYHPRGNGTYDVRHTGRYLYREEESTPAEEVMGKWVHNNFKTIPHKQSSQTILSAGKPTKERNRKISGHAKAGLWVRIPPK